MGASTSSRSYASSPSCNPSRASGASCSFDRPSEASYNSSGHFEAPTCNTILLQPIFEATAWLRTAAATAATATGFDMSKPAECNKQHYTDFTVLFRGGLFQADNQTDFVVKSGARKFHVHRIVLSCRSDIFRDMLYFNVTKMKDRSANIVFVGEALVEKFLRRLYNGNERIECEKIEDLEKLITLFDMYSMEAEVVECGELLLEKMEDDNSQIYDVIRILHKLGLNGHLRSAMRCLSAIPIAMWDMKALENLGAEVLATALKMQAETQARAESTDDE